MSTKNKYSSISQFIKDKRQEMNMTQESLASQIGVTAATISLYESGDRNPDLEKLRKIAEALEIPLAIFLNIEVPEENLDIALRSQKLDAKRIAEVKRYIQLLKYEQQTKKNN